MFPASYLFKPEPAFLATSGSPKNLKSGKFLVSVRKTDGSSVAENKGKNGASGVFVKAPWKIAPGNYILKSHISLMEIIMKAPFHAE